MKRIEFVKNFNWRFLLAYSREIRFTRLQLEIVYIWFCRAFAFLYGTAKKKRINIYPYIILTLINKYLISIWLNTPESKTFLENNRIFITMCLLHRKRTIWSLWCDVMPFHINIYIQYINIKLCVTFYIIQSLIMFNTTAKQHISGI